jgi:hypothetical protein
VPPCCHRPLRGPGRRPAERTGSEDRRSSFLRVRNEVQKRRRRGGRRWPLERWLKTTTTTTRDRGNYHSPIKPTLEMNAHRSAQVVKVVVDVDKVRCKKKIEREYRSGSAGGFLAGGSGNHPKEDAEWNARDGDETELRAIARPRRRSYNVNGASDDTVKSHWQRCMSRVERYMSLSGDAEAVKSKTLGSSAAHSTRRKLQMGVGAQWTA